MSDITCLSGQTLHIDAHTSPTAGVNSLIVTRNGVDMTVSFAGPTYRGFPELEAVQWSTSAPVELACIPATAAGSAAVVPSVTAADHLPFTGGHEIPAALLGVGLLLAGAPFLWGARKLARA